MIHFFRICLFTVVSFLFALSNVFGQSLSLPISVTWEGVQVETREKQPDIKWIKCEPCEGTFPHNQPVFFVDAAVPSGVELVNFSLQLGNTSALNGEESQLMDELGDNRAKNDYLNVVNVDGKFRLRGEVHLIRDVDGRLQKVNSATLSYELRPKRQSQRKSFVPNSVLSSGSWYKVAVKNNGVFKITPDILQQMGAPSSISSSSIQVYGNRGGMLPERVGDDFIDDLVEIPIAVFDGGDGTFSGNDYILFYAHGPHQWHYNQVDNRFDHTYNIYSNENHYFIRVDGSGGQRIQPGSVSGSAANTTVTTFDDFDFIEDSKVNLQRVGREWFGDIFDFNLSYNYAFPFPNLVPGSPVSIKIRVAGRTNVNGTRMEVTSGGTQVMTLNVLRFLANSKEFATASQGLATFPASGNSVNLNLTFNNQVNPAATAWLDYISVNVRRNLIFSGNQMTFRDVASVGVGNISEFTVNNVPPSAVLWDVTDPLQTFSLPLQFSGNTATFRVNTDTLRTFVLVNGSSLPEVSPVGKVENQNLHAMTPKDMIIITYPGFRAAAERLANFRRKHSGFSVEVVSTTEIYNEYHSGTQDISAIRNFLRSNYIKAPNGNGLKYAVLVGTASYDYKDVEPNNTNFVPAHQSPYSFNIEASYVSDDFYTFFDEGEGMMPLHIHTMEIAIGRLTVRSLSQANAVVDKIIRYDSSPNRFGNWRSRMLFVTDDVDANWEREFMEYSEEIIDSVSARYPFYNFQKIYADAYQQVSTAGSQRYPEVQDEIFRQVQNGALITNYIGHGGETGWAQEQILRLEEINNWSNIDKLSIFVTITCDFSRFDEVWRISAGEQTLLNPEGGAIALLSTTRVVGADPAQKLNRLMYQVYRNRVESGDYTIGNWMKETKNLSGSTVTVPFSLLGDPSIIIPFPEYNVVTESVHDVTTDQPTDTIRALSKTRIGGRVAHRNGVLVDDFNGEMQVAIFDKPMQRQTLVNDGVGSPFSFTTQNNAIYRGRVSVNTGRFSFEFITPVNISYQFGPGKFSYYGSAEAGEAAGGDQETIIGGLDTNAQADDEGPEIELYMNDESFVFGGMTDESPDMFAILVDSSGINTVGNSIGHDIVATLDHQTENPIVLNDYYTAELNSYQRGTIRYPFFDLDEGPHHLSLRAWDVHNNPSTAQTEFIVASSAGLALKHVLNYPNPFTTRTLFQFEHNRPNQPLEVLVQIFTVSGRLVKTIQANVYSQGNRVVDDIPWDGLDDFGDRIGKGVYVYRVKVRSTLDDARAEKMEKLVILR
ncbi:MAG: type IX secretion system sortase PorU [Cryomorphaceae bacterium]|nr:type IX secretion system sortase PorU [Cryomorphaceae bacterium]